MVFSLDESFCHERKLPKLLFAYFYVYEISPEIIRGLDQNLDVIEILQDTNKSSTREFCYLAEKSLIA